ncbi:MAG: prolipoprotein diacylglyceryl transferase [Pseudohongiellaceae bacterium]|nr:prolipoprotein diacylglyceryl transferase [Pseudohongiellaceae bacterium]
MLTYPDINPVAISLGPLTIHWYGIMYIIAFSGAWYLAKLRAKRNDYDWTNEQIADLIFYGALGVVIGGRLGSVLFYNFDRVLSDPIWALKLWEGGMSFHGGILGVMIALYWYSRHLGKHYFDVLDFIAPVVPFGLGAGRLGNFIGGELWGRQTDVPWGMVFPHVDNVPRHASQLYQFALEGLALFALMWWFSSKPRPRYAVAGLFGLGYGVQRFFVEFYREPDAGIGFIALDWMTMGQLLSLPMIAAGLILLTMAYKNKPTQSL